MTKYAVAYARYSSNNQREESIEAQIRAIREYCEKNDYVLIECYVDEAITGKNDNREDFQRMINAIVTGEIVVECVFVHKFNRFARNKFDSAIYKKKLKDFGVRVVSVTQSIDETPEGELMEGFLEVMDEYYSANLSIEVRKGLKENALKGQFVGGRLLYGFTLNENNEYIPNEEQAEIVKRIFNDYSVGKSIYKICNDLNEEGLLNQFGRPFSARTIGCMLRNERYIGNYVYKLSKKETIRHNGLIPQIIDIDVWQKVQSRHNEPKARENKKNLYYLTGKMFCSHCGYSCSGFGGGQELKNGEILYYYKCVGKNTHKNGCKASNINKKWIEQTVLKQLVDVLTDSAEVDALATTVYEETLKLQGNSPLKIKKLKKELNALFQQEEKLTRLYLQGKIDDKIIDKESTAIATRKLEIETALKKLENSSEISNISVSDIKETILLSFSSIREDYSNNPKEYIQALVNTFLDKVVVGNESVEIYIKFDFPTLPQLIGDRSQFNGAICRLSPFVHSYILLRKNIKYSMFQQWVSAQK